MKIKQGCPASGRRADPNGDDTSAPRTMDRPEFPSARYFQIHFEFIEELLGDIRLRLDALKQQVADFQQDFNYNAADDAGCQSRTTRRDSRSVRQAPDECGMETNPMKPSTVRPALSIKGNGKRPKARRKPSNAITPARGTASGE
jgi:hypothetical protein